MEVKLIDQISQMLCPPGEGVHTIHTAREHKHRLHSMMVGDENHEEYWREKLFQDWSDKVLLLGLPSDAGGGIQRGANWGPLMIREALYRHGIPKGIIDIGDIRVNPHLLQDDLLNEKTLKSCRNFFYGNPDLDLPVSPLSMAERLASEIWLANPNQKLITLGGDHSISFPLSKAFLKTRGNRKIGFLHFDAHTDLLESRMGIDICFGSWTSHIIKMMPHPYLFTQFGIRSTGFDRGHWEKKFGIKQIWAKEILKNGIQKYIDSVTDLFHREGVTELYITVDIDALDSRYAGATGTPESEGLSLDHICRTIESFGEQFVIRGFDLAEVAPFVNWDNCAIEPDTTLLSASQILKVAIDQMVSHDD